MAGDPRIRGEHEDKRYADWDRAGSSPHTRGARLAHYLPLEADAIIPAYAGSTGPPPAETQRRLHHPRIRGEHDVFADQVAQTKGSSPHTRGAQQRERKTLMLTGIIPAYAGSTRHGHSHLLLYPDHPRISGEHQSSARQCRWRDGSSPHTRGARLRPLKDFAPRPIIPAYAGSTASRGGSAREAADHPRIRGEHNKEIPAPAARPGSSPHTRGAPDPASRPDPPGRIIPAYAGSTARKAGHPAWSGGSSPHTRGALRSLSVSPGGHGSSPHTRGAPSPVSRQPTIRRIIPAYAGSTAAPPRRRAMKPDHPRIRGEHRSGGRRQTGFLGSSPHTRGAQRRFEWLHTLWGIIPAYAGSTHRLGCAGDFGRDHPRIRGEHHD